MGELWDVFDKDGNMTGKVQERGWMQPGNYHLIVHVWIRNKNGDFLISKRTSGKRWPGMWACTIGSAVSGDDSRNTAIKETAEELGVLLEPESGQLFKRYRTDFDNNCGEFIDVWLFDQDIDITNVILKPDETCDVMLVSAKEIKQMIDEKTFLSDNKEECPYIEELFDFCNEGMQGDS